MENQYSTLQILAGAVQELPNPTAYLCTPREMILRADYDWTTIYAHLKLLEAENLVQLIAGESVQFSITMAGLEKANETLKIVKAD